MNSMDPSNVHSQGWELIDQNKIPKKLIVPNFDASPPTVEECKKFIPNIERVEKFYADGEIRQQYYVKAVDDEKKKFIDQKKRIEEQLSSLHRFPVDLTRRMSMENDLNNELKRVNIEIVARERAHEKLVTLNKKRAELVDTMKYLNVLMKDHCSRLGAFGDPQKKN